MLDLDTRTAIHQLARAGQPIRAIARALGLSRNAVRRVLRSGRAEVPKLERAEFLAEHLDQVRELYVACGGNLVRVHEELAAAGVAASYSSVTAFCQRHGIGARVRPRAGRYDFEPGAEMQHDTSPHTVEIAGARRRVECAELILGYSRKVYAQVYVRWSRFECKAFLSEALCYLGGAAARCVIDNHAVVVARGNGAGAQMAPEMEAFAKRFGFVFMAYELNDKDRSGKVERNHHYIENNFYAGRCFESVADLNEQLRAWCDKVNRSGRKLWGERRQVPEELFVAEQPLLRPLPLHIPEVYQVHSRRVDVEGYVNVATNRYSVPPEIREGRRLELRETLDRIRVFDGHELVCEHDRREPGAHKRVTLPEHRHTGRRTKQRRPLPEEGSLRAVDPEVAAFIDQLQKRHGGRAARVVQRLHRMYLEYPTECLVEAIRAANAYGLFDLHRLERMTLARIQGDFFRLPDPDDPDPEDQDG